MQAFDFINDIVGWFIQFVPEWDLLDPTQGGVKFTPGKWWHKEGSVKLLRPGRIYWYWPITTNVYTIETKRQPLIISVRLTTKDGYSVLVEVTIIFEIVDVKLALVSCRDFEDTIGEVGEKLTVKPIMSREFNEILTDLSVSNKLNNEIKSAARSELRSYGVGVIDGFVSSFAATTVFSHDGSGMVVQGGEEDE